VELGAFGTSAGVDVLSYGGTKNGAMGAEAVVSYLPPEEAGLRFIRKQSMQLASKMRFIAAQFVTLLSDDLWRHNAEHANAMARRLSEGVARVPGVTLAYPTQANGVFASFPAAVTEALQEEFPFYVWDVRTGVVRLMTSFDTDEEDVDAFIELVSTVMGELG
jgi:threonine aldolase